MPVNIAFRSIYCFSNWGTLENWIRSDNRVLFTKLPPWENECHSFSKEQPFQGHPSFPIKPATLGKYTEWPLWDLVVLETTRAISHRSSAKLLTFYTTWLPASQTLSDASQNPDHSQKLSNINGNAESVPGWRGLFLVFDYRPRIP